MSESFVSSTPPDGMTRTRYTKVSEREIEAKCRDIAEQNGCLFLKFDPTLSGVGMPDRILIAPGGVVIFCELKTPTGKLRPVQEVRIRQLRGLGCRVEIVRAVDQFKEPLDEVIYG